MLAWGIPDFERENKIYRQNRGLGRYIFNAKYPYSDFSDSELNKKEDLPIIGEEVSWSYIDRLPKKQYIKFDRWGYLSERSQTYRMNDDVMQPNDLANKKPRN